jgi:hypothetical protein
VPSGSGSESRPEQEGTAAAHRAVQGSIWRRNPGDVITSAGICSHFALNPEEALSALTALEQGEFPPEVKLRPLYPGVPLGPLSAVTGVTKRILSNLRPPRQGRGSSGRNDWWKDTFKQSRDFRVWSAMRAEVGYPLNGWRR